MFKIYQVLLKLHSRKDKFGPKPECCRYAVDGRQPKGTRVLRRASANEFDLAAPLLGYQQALIPLLEQLQGKSTEKPFQHWP